MDRADITGTKRMSFVTELRFMRDGMSFVRESLNERYF
jgi:hypothetical protein